MLASAAIEALNVIEESPGLVLDLTQKSIKVIYARTTCELPIHMGLCPCLRSCHMAPVSNHELNAQHYP